MRVRLGRCPANLDYLTSFETLYCGTSFEGKVCMHFVDASDIDIFTACTCMCPALNRGSAIYDIVWMVLYHHDAAL